MHLPEGDLMPGSAEELPLTSGGDSEDERWMREAIAEALAAEAAGDVPVGAVLVDPSRGLVVPGRNRRELRGDPVAHAEIEALRDAAEARGSWRLEGCTLYVTLEPCPMCAGALVNARVSRVVYGCLDPKAGAVDTFYGIGKDERLNHRFEVRGGVLAEECAALLKSFFGAKRRAAAAAKKAALTLGAAPAQGPSRESSRSLAEEASGSRAPSDPPLSACEGPDEPGSPSGLVDATP